MNRINQDRIAEQLNISRTTVSRSLANHPSISADTREKVLKLAGDLGYRSSPSRMLRRKRSGKPLTVGVLIGVPAANVAMATFPYILKGIRERADAERIAVDVCYQDPATFDPTAKRQTVFRQIRTADWRGVILIYPFPIAAVDLIARKISAVAVLEDYAELGLDSIDVAEADGIASLVQELTARGHKRIGFVARHYPIGGHWTLRRFGGFVEGIFRQGLEFHPEWVFNVHRNAPQLTPAQLVPEVAARTRRDGVTAWVCAADHQAYELMADLAKLDIKVPRDCSITGFDGIEPPAGLPRVTSMQVAHEDIGSSALARLASRIVHPNAPRRKILVEARLVEGATIAPPSA
jgi:LacI family transcriptional regulator